MKSKPLVLFTDRAWLFPFLASSIVSLTLILSSIAHLKSSQSAALPHPSLSSSDGKLDAHYNEVPISAPSAPSLPKLAYLVSGTKGDGQRMKRVLQAIYHPHNRYLLHLDLEAPPKERIDLARYVKSHPTFVAVGNVDVIGKSNLVTYRGPTMMACTLHAAAILLKKDADWDWFINLSASDYPLMTQDATSGSSMTYKGCLTYCRHFTGYFSKQEYVCKDFLHVLSLLPRDLNFIEHSSQLGWKEYQRVKPIIIDPGLYLSKKADVFLASQRRTVPNAFKLFVGSAWVVLTRGFVEYCVRGWDNLPRIVFMYFANVVSSPEGYFHTVICNAKEYRNTTVNHDLHYIAWDVPPKQHPLTLSSKDFGKMKSSGAPFARKFDKEDPILDRIDRELLGRRQHDHFTPGGWCIGSNVDHVDPCAERGDATILKPGTGAKRFEKLVLKLLSPESFRINQCNSTR